MDFLPGDIAACHGADWTSRLIRWGTSTLFPPAGLRVGPSHVAVLCPWRQRMVWAESTTLCPHNCLIQNRPVSGAQLHPPELRIRDYLDHRGRVDIYRLTPFHRLSPQESRLLTWLILNEFIDPGTNYDLEGALFSGTHVLPFSRWFPGGSLDQLFCSEMVAAIVMRLNRMNHSNPTRYNPARLLRELVRTGKYTRVATLRPDQSLRAHSPAREET